MKNILFLLLFCPLLSFNSQPFDTDTLEKPFRRVYINETLTSTNGCKVHIEGYVEFTILPPKFIGFEGTVSISGPKGCPNGSLTFAKREINPDLIVEPDVDDICNLRSLTWYGSRSDFVDVLNEREINSALVTVLRQVCNE